MLAYPKVGERVVIWYGKAVAKRRALHGLHGTVRVVSAPGVKWTPTRFLRDGVATPGYLRAVAPRNHGIELDGGGLVVVPCGNVRRPKPGEDS